MQPDASVAKNTDTQHTPPTGKVVLLRETPTPVSPHDGSPVARER